MNKPLIIITGASTDIGAAMARLFSSAEYSLGLISRNLQAMQEMKLPNAICLSADVTDYEDLKNAIKTAENKFGAVDCLINNAGYMQFGEFVELTHDLHERTVKTNLMSVIMELLDAYLVEAAGIEPASASSLPLDLHV